MKILSIILSGSLVLSSLFADNAISMSKDSDKVNVVLKSNEDVYGIQFDVTYDPSVVSVNEDAITSLPNTYAKVKEDGLLRVVMFSLTGEKLLDADMLDSANLMGLIFDSVSDRNEASTIEISNVIVAGYNGKEVILDSPTASFGFESNSEIPATTSLSANYPNPFNPSTTFDFSLSKPGMVTLSIFDLNGKLVNQLVSDYKNPGNYSVTWNGTTNSGTQVASGEYIMQMVAPGFSDTRRMTLLK